MKNEKNANDNKSNNDDNNNNSNKTKSNSIMLNTIGEEAFYPFFLMVECFAYS